MPIEMVCSSRCKNLSIPSLELVLGKSNFVLAVPTWCGSSRFLHANWKHDMSKMDQTQIANSIKSFVRTCNPIWVKLSARGERKTTSSSVSQSNHNKSVPDHLNFFLRRLLQNSFAIQSPHAKTKYLSVSAGYHHCSFLSNKKNRISRPRFDN